MMKTAKLALLASALLCGSVHAQENEFDLSSQRSEIQDVKKVTGERLDHSGIVVNPVPHQLQFLGGFVLDVSEGIALKDRSGRFEDDVDFLKKSSGGVKLSVDFGRKVAERKGVSLISGAYVLTVGKKDIGIWGYDERGAFYGLQTLRQLVRGDGTVPCVYVNDYPDLPDRGVVEGFYGEPWSHEVRLSLIDFYGKFKMNAYIYGPKDDPYHSCPHWRKPYPEKEAQNIRELVDACHRNHVDFVWAIHPGQDIKWNDEDYQNLVHKFNLMYDLGVRSFAIFFDDISGDGTDPRKQADLLNRLTEGFVNEKGDVSPLIVCPTDYSQLWANPSENGALAIYGKTLDPGIKVFWTGAVVCSDLTPETLEFVDSRIMRPAYYWWNFPVTDYARHILMQGPSYGLDSTLTAEDLCGIVSNPMEHGEASKLALYSVADYSWNIAGYNAMDSWERGLKELAPEAAEAYRTFAIHSCDTENGYRRDESWETETFRLAGWSDEVADALQKEFSKIEDVPGEIESGCRNSLLVNELHPWLVEFGKLGVRGRKAIELGRMYKSGGDNAAFWNAFVDNLMSPEDRAAYNAHKSGTMKLQPFYEYMMDDMAHGFLQKLTGHVPEDYVGIGSFSTSATVQTKLMLDNDDSTYYTSGASQIEGSWIGVDLRALRLVSEVRVLQGRNSVDDGDYFDHAVLECSADGRTWSPLIEDLDKQYVIEWKGEPMEARYVRLRRLDSDKKSYAAVRSFEVNPLKVENLGFSLEADDVAEALKAFDDNPSTSYTGSMRFGVTPGAHDYVLLMGRLEQPVKCSQLDASGSVVAESVLTSAFSQIDVVPGAASICIDGSPEIFEILSRQEPHRQ